jgi:hypothetical protein
MDFLHFFILDAVPVEGLALVKVTVPANPNSWLCLRLPFDSVEGLALADSARRFSPLRPVEGPTLSDWHAFCIGLPGS